MPDAFTALRAAGYTGQLGDMLAAYLESNPSAITQLGGDKWSTHWAGLSPARTIGDVIAGLEGWFDRGFTASPWQNQGTETDIDLIATNVTASAGAANMGATGDLASTLVAARLAPQAGQSFTIVTAGVFNFTSRNFPVGTRTSTTNTLANTGFCMAFRTDGTIRLYASDGTTLVERVGLNVASYANDVAVITARFDRTANKMSLRVNGDEIGESGSIAALGALEATSSFNIGTAGLPAQGIVSGVAWDRSVIPDADLALIEAAFGV